MNTSSSDAFIPTPPYKHLRHTTPVSVRARPKNEPFSSLEKSQAAFILLLGPTGSGKSTFIEALAKEGAALGISKNQLDSVTQDIVSYQLVNVHQKRDHDRKHDEYTFHIIDTPGFSDNALSELKVFNMLVDWMERLQGPPVDDSSQKIPRGLKETGRRSVIDHILYFHPITDPRIPGSKSRLIQMLTALTVSDLGDSRKNDNDMSRVSIITTMWDNVLTPERVNIRFEQLKATNGPCRDFVGNGSQVLKFENTRESALAILDSTSSQRFGHFFRFERMIIKDEHVRDTPFGRSFYKMLCERINRLVDEKSAISDMMQEQNSDEDGYWSSRLGKLETQLREFEQEVECFGPPPTGSVVSFYHLFEEEYGMSLASASSARPRSAFTARLSMLKSRAKTIFRFGTLVKDRKASKKS